MERDYLLPEVLEEISSYELSSAFDVSTATYNGEYDTSSQDTETFSLRFNNDGSKMFMLGYASDKVHEYSLASPYNLIDVHDEHSGDVIHTSNTDSYDTDPDSDTLTVTAIRVGSFGLGNAYLDGTTDGTYGTNNELYQFILTLLTKQSWCLIQEML